VRGEGSARRLVPLATERPESYRLVEDGGDLRIEGAGRAISVEKGSVEGYVDSFQPDDQGARIGGWAVATEGHLPAQRILVFADGRLVGQGAPTLQRPDIRGDLGEQAAKSGFDLRAGAPGAEAADFRVFAVRGDDASELPRYER